MTKSKFFHKKDDYLGHFIKPGVFEVDTDMIEAFSKVKPQTSVRGIRSFLELCYVFWRFVKGLSRIAAHMNKMLPKRFPKKFDTLGHHARRIFERLK